MTSYDFNNDGFARKAIRHQTQKALQEKAEKQPRQHHGIGDAISAFSKIGLKIAPKVVGKVAPKAIPIIGQLYQIASAANDARHGIRLLHKYKTDDDFANWLNEHYSNSDFARDLLLGNGDDVIQRYESYKKQQEKNVNPSDEEYLKRLQNAREKFKKDHPSTENGTSQQQSDGGGREGSQQSQNNQNQTTQNNQNQTTQNNQNQGTQNTQSGIPGGKGKDDDEEEDQNRYRKINSEPKSQSKKISSYSKEMIDMVNKQLREPWLKAYLARQKLIMARTTNADTPHIEELEEEANKAEREFSEVRDYYNGQFNGGKYDITDFSPYHQQALYTDPSRLDTQMMREYQKYLDENPYDPLFNEKVNPINPKKIADSSLSNDFSEEEFKEFSKIMKFFDPNKIIDKKWFSDTDNFIKNNTKKPNAERTEKQKEQDKYYSDLLAQAYEKNERKYKEFSEIQSKIETLVRQRDPGLIEKGQLKRLMNDAEKLKNEINQQILGKTNRIRFNRYKQYLDEVQEKELNEELLPLRGNHNHNHNHNDEGGDPEDNEGNGPGNNNEGGDPEDNEGNGPGNNNEGGDPENNGGDNRPWWEDFIPNKDTSKGGILGYLLSQYINGRKKDNEIIKDGKGQPQDDGDRKKNNQKNQSNQQSVNRDGTFNPSQDYLDTINHRNQNNQQQTQGSKIRFKNYNQGKQGVLNPPDNTDQQSGDTSNDSNPLDDALNPQNGFNPPPTVDQTGNPIDYNPVVDKVRNQFNIQNGAPVDTTTGGRSTVSPRVDPHTQHQSEYAANHNFFKGKRKGGRIQKGSIANAFLQTQAGRKSLQRHSPPQGLMKASVSTGSRNELPLSKAFLMSATGKKHLGKGMF